MNKADFQKVADDFARTVFQSLIPTILDIDGGCHSCISKFAERVQRVTLKYGVKYEVYDLPGGSWSLRLVPAARDEVKPK